MPILIARIVTKKLAKIWVYARENRAARLLTRAYNLNAASSPGLQGKTVGTRLTKRRRQRELQFVVTFSMRGRGTTPKGGEGISVHGGRDGNPSSLLPRTCSRAHNPIPFPFERLPWRLHFISICRCIRILRYISLPSVHPRRDYGVKLTRLSTFFLFGPLTINPHGLHLL